MYFFSGISTPSLFFLTVRHTGKLYNTVSLGEGVCVAKYDSGRWSGGQYVTVKIITFWQGKVKIKSLSVALGELDCVVFLMENYAHIVFLWSCETSFI